MQGPRHCQPRLRSVVEPGLPGVRTDVTRTFCVASIERDRADHRSVEIDREKAWASPERVRHLALDLTTQSRAGFGRPCS